MKKAIKRTMTIAQFEEMRDTRIVLGIMGLFYVCNILTLYNSVCHIMMFHVSDLVLMLGILSLVINSTFKFVVYVSLSDRFRHSFLSCYYTKVPTENVDWTINVQVPY